MTQSIPQLLQLALNKDEIQALLDILKLDHDGSDFEAECPNCKAYQKLTAMLSAPSGDAAAQGAAREPLTVDQILSYGQLIDSDGSAWPKFISEGEKRVWIVRRVEEHFGIGIPPQGVDHG